MRIICAVLLMAVAGPVGAAAAGGGAQAPQPGAPAAPAGGGVAAPGSGGAPAPSIELAIPAPEPVHQPLSGDVRVVPPPFRPEANAPQPADAPIPPEPTEPTVAVQTNPPDAPAADMTLSPADVAAATAAPLAPMARVAQQEGGSRGEDRPRDEIEVPVPEEAPAQVDTFAAESPAGLPRTGRNMSGPATGGIAMLAAGLALLTLSRRRVLG